MFATPKHHALSPQQSGADVLGTPLLIAVPDAARLLGIGTTFAWELVRAGDIPSVKLGRRVLVPRAALEHLAGAHRPEGAQGQEVDDISLPVVSTIHRSHDRASRKGVGNGTRTK